MISSNCLSNYSSSPSFVKENLINAFAPSYMTIKGEDAHQNMLHVQLSLLTQSQKITVVFSSKAALPEVYFDNNNLESYTIPTKFTDGHLLDVSNRDNFLPLIIESIFYEMLSIYFRNDSKLKSDCLKLIRLPCFNSCMKLDDKFRISYTDVKLRYAVKLVFSLEQGTLTVTPPMNIKLYKDFSIPFTFQEIEKQGIISLSEKCILNFEANKNQIYLMNFVGDLQEMEFKQIDKAAEFESAWYIGFYKEYCIYTKFILLKDDAFMLIKQADCRYERRYSLLGKSVGQLLHEFTMERN